MRSKLVGMLCALSCGAAAGAANAQVIEPLVPIPPLPTAPSAPAQPGQPDIIGKTVTDRARPEIDPLGMRFGDFFFYPRAEIDQGYNDNIFATTNGRVGSFFTTLMPSFDLVSNLPQNQFVLSGGAALGRDEGHSSENYDDAFGSARGRIDVTALTSIRLSLRADREHIPRFSPDSPGTAATPVAYNVETGDIGVSQTGTRVGYDVDAIVTRSDYMAPPAIGGGFVPQDDQNATGYEGAVRVYYEFMPDYQAFVRASGNTQQYDHAAGTISPGITIPTRNSNGYRVDLGARIDLTGVTFVEAYAGYIAQEYTAAAFSTIRGIDYGATMVWNATTLDTVKASAIRTVNNANAEVVGIADSPGYLASIQTVSIDHELLRNVLLNANVSYEVDNWANINRTDYVVGGGFGAKYLVSRNVYLGATYTYQQRESHGGLAVGAIPFSQNIFLLRLSTQL